MPHPKFPKHKCCLRYYKLTLRSPNYYFHVAQLVMYSLPPKTPYVKMRTLTDGEKVLMKNATAAQALPTIATTRQPYLLARAPAIGPKFKLKTQMQKRTVLRLCAPLGILGILYTHYLICPIQHRPNPCCFSFIFLEVKKEL